MRAARSSRPRAEGASKPIRIQCPATIAAAGTKPKVIEEFVSICCPAFSPELVHRDEG